MTHPTEALPAYAAGTLASTAAEEIAGHLRRCAPCRADAASWSLLASGVRAATLAVTPQDPPPFAAMRARLTSGPAVPRYVPRAAVDRLAPARIAWGLLTRQVRLVGWRVWAVAVVLIAAGAGFAASAPAARAGNMLSLVVPLVAGLAVAAACGADGEAAELVRATPTSTRVLVLARLTLVLAVTVGVGTLASAAMAWPRGDLVLTELFLTWFGPLVPLSALSFALAVLWRPEVGAATVLACWMLRLLAPTALLDRGLAPVLDALWQPGPALLLGAVAVTVAAVALAPLAGRRGVRTVLS
ncbi:zf-HC2 domain-containing protein [Asanoa sp. NPDC050611]|uniref:zf-HC2 domain-containing protein n=1 Tax=Asanoa sp. NPDC050611 TaxID=3157098 RepID=UPI00340CCE41